MKQISRGVGWVWTLSRRLLWTKDNGASWTDITPPGPPDQYLYSFFFLDASHAWAVFVYGSWDWDGPVRMVLTQNGGKTWSPLHFDRLSYPGLKDAPAAPTTLWFVDSKHGWFLWRGESSTAFSWGFLFSTVDGGVTWTELPRPPSAGPFRFNTPKDGWMVTGASGDGLDVSHDGGRTWQEVSIPVPADCNECVPSFGVPIFQGKNNGSLAVTYGTDRLVNATYATHDAGEKWQVMEAFEQTDSHFEETGLDSMVEGHVIRVFNSKTNDEIQIRNGSRVINSPYPKDLLPRGRIEAIDFIDDQDGWLVHNSNSGTSFHQLDLLATTDGGKRSR